MKMHKTQRVCKISIYSHMCLHYMVSNIKYIVFKEFGVFVEELFVGHQQLSDIKFIRNLKMKILILIFAF